MATQAAVAETKKEETTEQTTDRPLLDLNNDAVKKLIKAAKKRGFVTVDELNSVLPSEEVNSEQIEDTMSMLSEMGINVVEDEEAAEEASEETSSALVETGKTAVATVAKKEPTDRTDDPVRMYLREMGSVELLSREGEIAIAKRIEAGRETMIAGLCESPLTFQAIIIWRDELNRRPNILLRDIIDLEATYAGPDAKQNVPVNPNAPASVAEEVRQKAQVANILLKRLPDERQLPRAATRMRRSRNPSLAKTPARKARPAKMTTMMTTWRIPCRSRPWRPS